MEKLILLLLVVATAFELAHARFPNLPGKPFSHRPSTDLGEPLILTSYLEGGRIQDAKDASKVNLPAFQDTKSYSGYFNVDKENNGSLFFWFFPSENNYAEDPVILWLQGGPGGSSLFGLFAENGPFVVDKNFNVSKRPFSWTKNHSVLYIDQPVGTGYSFTDENSLVTDQYQVADHLHNCLTQFFTLFSEVQNNSFYISGESYAGKYIPAIGYAIHQRNKNATLKINLQGLLIGNGLSDPIHQFKYGDLLYQVGLIDLPTLKYFNKQEETVVNYIKQEKYYLATQTWNSLLETYSSFTQLDNVYNYLEDTDNSPTAWESFVVQDDVRRALHVGNQLYEKINYDVYDALYYDITVSVAPWVVELLNHNRVLVFNGNLDIIVGYPLTENYLQNLNFSAAEEYKTASRDPWFVGNHVAGYVKTAGNLTEVMVRNAGHMVPMDQPEHAFDLVYKFIRNKLLTK